MTETELEAPERMKTQALSLRDYRIDSEPPSTLSEFANAKLPPEDRERILAKLHLPAKQ